MKKMNDAQNGSALKLEVSSYVAQLAVGDLRTRQGTRLSHISGRNR